MKISNARKTESETPRTNNFVRTQAAVSFDPADFVSQEAHRRVTTHVREHLIGWASFAANLERELMQSVPKEWKPGRNRSNDQ